MTLGADQISRTEESANRIIADAMVFNATEAIRSGGENDPRLLLGLDEIPANLISDWRVQGLNAVMIPHGWLDPTDLLKAVDHVNLALQVFLKWTSFVAAHPEDLLMVTKADHFDLAKKTSRIGIVLGTHNGGDLFRSADDVEYWHGFGLRHALLTCFGQNRLGTSVDEGDEHDGGLTRLGRSIVARMNEIGMVVDVSHCGLKTRRDAIDASSKPVFISHGNSASICPLSRNNSDEMLKALAANGGVIGLMVWRPTVSLQELVSVEHVVDHFEHISQLIGPRHIGLGLEVPALGFDDCVNLPKVHYLGEPRSMDIPELCGNRRIWTLVDGLLRRGFSDADISGFLGGNFWRAYSEVFVES